MCSLEKAKTTATTSATSLMAAVEAPLVAEGARVLVETGGGMGGADRNQTRRPQTPQQLRCGYKGADNVAQPAYSPHYTADKENTNTICMGSAFIHEQ
jgi:hypothetical protein